MSKLNPDGEAANTASAARLLAIVEVDKTERVNCQQPGCKHTVYKAVHVVREAGKLLTLGSTCYAKRYGGLAALGAASYGGSTGRRLTTEERAMLAGNTETLLAHFEQEQEQMRQEATLKLQRLREAQARLSPPSRFPAAPVSRAYGAPPLPTRARWPWAWMLPSSSVFAVKLRDGTGWVRLQHKNKRHFIVPWPSFEDWDEALPPVVGRPNMEFGGYEVVGEIGDTVAYLRAHAEKVKTTGLWSDVIALLGDGRGTART